MARRRPILKGLPTIEFWNRWYWTYVLWVWHCMRLPKIDLLEFEISTSNYCLAYYREVYLAKGVPEDWILVEILSPSIGHFHSDHESSFEFLNSERNSKQNSPALPIQSSNSKKRDTRSSPVAKQWLNPSTVESFVN